MVKMHISEFNVIKMYTKCEVDGLNVKFRNVYDDGMVFQFNGMPSAITDKWKDAYFLVHIEKIPTEVMEDIIEEKKQNGLHPKGDLS